MPTIGPTIYVNGRQLEVKSQEDDRFWFVFREQGGPPTQRHATESSARTEAERLANMYPGHEFHVLECIGTVKKTSVVWTNRTK